MKAQRKKSKGKILLGEFLEKNYYPWFEANSKTAKQTMYTFNSVFQFLLGKPICDISLHDIEFWRKRRQEVGIKASTINRQIAVLKASLNWGVERELIESNPLDRLKRLQECDSNKERVRYLNDEERERLLAALDAREAHLRAGRSNHNKWLTERGQETLPALDGKFADYLKPLVLLALNLGIRRGNLFPLKWGDVDFANKEIYIFDDINMNSSINSHVYMNETAFEIITTWHQQSEDTSQDAWVFPSSTRKGEHITSIQHSWKGVLKEAKIENFHFHDLRHNFASQLVMQGIDLNTVRGLLGYAGMKTMINYAHLA